MVNEKKKNLKLFNSEKCTLAFDNGECLEWNTFQEI